MKYLHTISLITLLAMLSASQVCAYSGEQMGILPSPDQQTDQGLATKVETLSTDTDTDKKDKQPEWAFLGIYSADVSSSKAEKLGFDNPYGSYVTGILGNTAAEKAGIRPFDYLYGIDEFRTGAEQNLTAILRKYRPGDEAVVHLIREGQKQTLDVKFGRRSDARRGERSECEDPFLGVSQTSNDSDRGVRVSIVENSTAASIGIPKDAIITRINGYPILDWTDMGTAVDMLQVGAEIEVEYLQNEQAKTARGPIKSYCETKTRTNKLFNWDWDFDFDFDFDRSEPKNENWTYEKKDNRNISGMKATVGPLSPEEARELRNEYRLNFPQTSNLRAERLSVTPQPETGLFQLRFELPKRGETMVRLYNDAGRQIYEYDLGSFSGEFSDEVDIAQNGPGAYFLLIEQSGDTFTRKIKVEN